MKKFILISLLLIIVITLFMIIQPPKVATEKKTAKQLTQTSKDEFKTERGTIFDRNYNRLAGNYPSYDIYAKPQEIDNHEQLAAQLAKILHQDQQQLLTGLRAVRGYLWLAKNSDRVTVEQIKKINAKGIHFKENMRRYYPHKRLAAHTIGFSKENQGLDGLESRFDSLLRSEPQDMASLPMIDFGDAEQLGNDGAHLVTTIDLSAQKHIEQSLSQLIGTTDARSGSVILLNPQTGAVLAMASQPTYDPNTFWNFAQNNRRNRAVTDTIINGALDPLFNEALQNFTTSKTVRMPSGRMLQLVSPTQTKRTISYKKTDKGREILSFFRTLLASANSSQLIFDELLGMKTTAQNTGGGSLATSIQLAATLITLLNNGNMITPHILSSIRDRATQQNFFRNDGVLPNLFSKEEYEFLQQQFSALSISGHRGSQFIETTLASQIIKQSIDRDGYTNEPLGPKQNQLITIASSPTLFMLISLDKAQLSDAVASGRKESAVMIYSRKLMPQLINIINNKPGSVTDEFWKSSWNNSQEPVQGEKTNNSDSSTGDQQDFYMMPDVRSKSLRGALQVLQDLNLHVTIGGSGRVTGQQPTAGQPVQEGDTCVLELQSNN